MGTEKILQTTYSHCNEGYQAKYRMSSGGGGRRTPPRVEHLFSVKIDNIPYNTSLNEIRRRFETYGTIGDIYVPRDPRDPEQSRGFAFVRYCRESAAENAIRSLDGTRMLGRKLRMSMAKHAKTDNKSMADRDHNSYHSDQLGHHPRVSFNSTKEGDIRRTFFTSEGRPPLRSHHPLPPLPLPPRHSTRGSRKFPQPRRRKTTSAKQTSTERSTRRRSSSLSPHKPEQDGRKSASLRGRSRSRSNNDNDNDNNKNNESGEEATSVGSVDKHRSMLSPSPPRFHKRPSSKSPSSTTRRRRRRHSHVRSRSPHSPSLSSKEMF